MQTTDNKGDRKAGDDVAHLLVGSSRAMESLRAMIFRVAQSSAPVLICGPSGSGKEMVAQAIHQASNRRSESFVALNCGAIPSELIESELFGHERGAFTGAHTRRVGRFEAADKGTLFLDEIGDMRFDMQVRLLRVLEERGVARVGGTEITPVDVRVISATHQDLDRAISEQRFREDLYFRLGVIVLNVPDLTSRVEDIPELIAHFQAGREPAARAGFSDAAIARLMSHPWRGNVRELRNVVERADVLFAGETIGGAQAELLLGNITRALPYAPSPQIGGDSPVDLKAQVESLELDQIRHALLRAEGIVSEAARLLTLKRTTLIEKMRKYGVERLAA